MKSFNKNVKGITLIALVITIIILIILSSVVIYLSLGENGMLIRAKQAKTDYESATDEEKQSLNDLYSQMFIATNDDAEVTLTVKRLKELLDENKTKEIVLWEGTANAVGEYTFTDPSYDVDSFDRIIIEYSQLDVLKSSTSIQKEQIIKDKAIDIALWGYGSRFTALHFVNNGFYVDKIVSENSVHYLYINKIIGIKY